MNRKVRIGYALLSGVLFGLAMSQWMNALLLMIAFVPLLLVEEYLDQHKQEHKSVQFFLYSLLSFTVWNSISTWWIFNASAVGMLAAIILNSLFMSTVMWLFHISKRKLGRKFGYFTFIFYWIAFEYFNLNWELSWSWLNLGNAFAKNVSLIQWYEFTGMFGGSLWVLLANLIILLAVLKYIKFHSFKAIRLNLIVLSVWILFPVIISLIQFNSFDESSNTHRVVIIQPNIDPYNEKFNGMSEYEQVQRILSLAESVADSTVEYFVAPETALPRTVWERRLNNSRSIISIRKFLLKYPNAKFIIGASTRKLFLPGEKLSATARSFRDTAIYYDNFNSALQIDTSNNISIYHKSQLVVGVEKMPFPETLGFLEKLALDLGGTTGSLGTQEERSTFNSGNGSIRIAPVICYESIFGEYVNRYIKNGANLISVITNDAWWGDTPGYRQHLRFSQLRAIETRRYVVRSANTGISAFINQRGELIQPTKYWTKAALKYDVCLNNKLTLYVIYGNYIARIISFLAALTFLITITKVLRNKENEDL